jgi:hypothetical protein
MFAIIAFIIVKIVLSLLIVAAVEIFRSQPHPA